ncbi:uncharacterized protein LOC112556232 isoform X2 [Pomacea canaliculata]|uniref:uncharacterized protein LOC112556232 isoform X2 n=1 Tax=Pomacea canaliculata TaxID=400727 RepID=UPI000D729F61|nr:uncharacterized protein LOC112556232 isoform X2 [Pomacea canaliculata]
MIHLGQSHDMPRVVCCLLPMIIENDCTKKFKWAKLWLMVPTIIRKYWCTHPNSIWAKAWGRTFLEVSTILAVQKIYKYVVSTLRCQASAFDIDSDSSALHLTHTNIHGIASGNLFMIYFLSQSQNSSGK